MSEESLPLTTEQRCPRCGADGDSVAKDVLLEVPMIGPKRTQNAEVTDELSPVQTNHSSTFENRPDRLSTQWGLIEASERRRS